MLFLSLSYFTQQIWYQSHLWFFGRLSKTRFMSAGEREASLWELNTVDRKPCPTTTPTLPCSSRFPYLKGKISPLMSKDEHNTQIAGDYRIWWRMGTLNRIRHRVNPTNSCWGLARKMRRLFSHPISTR